MDQNQSSSAFGELNVTPPLDHSFGQATTWARVVGIIFIVVMSLLLLFAFVSGTFIAQFATTAEMPEGSTGVFTAIIVVMALFVCGIGGVLVYFLMRFASRTREGIRTGNQYMFNQGLAALKNFFIMYGVISILGLLFSAVGIFSLL